MRHERLPALLAGLAFACAGALYGLTSGLVAAGLVLAALFVVAGLVTRRLRASLALQVILALGGVIAAWLVAATVVPPAMRGALRTLSPIPSGVALAGLLLALPRLILAAPRGGPAATMALGVVAVTASGLGDVGPLYPVLAISFLLLGVAAIDGSDAGRPRLGAWTRRRRVAALVGLLGAAGACLAAAAGLPLAYDEALRVSGIVPRGSRAGFTTTLRLGSLSGMLLSEEPVLRVYGPAPRYLRGVVYTRYENARWRSPHADRPRLVETGEATAAISPEATVIRRAGPEERRFFLPLGTRGLRLEGGTGLVDSMGIVYPSRDEPADLAILALGARDVSVVAPPTEEDLEVPAEIAPRLGEIARSWTEGATSDAERLEALQRHFDRDFEYALFHHRPPRSEPVLFFLTRGRRGHCEYFASAMALLARSLGIPARVVGGYVVVERNPIGGYRLVRQRHAHAWVEAWVGDRGWQTVDPTPVIPSEDAAPNETPWLAALSDLLGSWLVLAARWVLTRSPTELVAAGATVLLVWLGWRGVAALLRRRRRAARPRKREGYEGPLPALAPLLEALDRRGASRGRTEPLEAFAERLASDPALGDEGVTVAELLRRYAAFRFGGLGDGKLLVRDLEAWTAEHR